MVGDVNYAAEKRERRQRAQRGKAFAEKWKGRGDELGDRQYELQRQIKRVFDLKNILNRGKVFAE